MATSRLPKGVKPVDKSSIRGRLKNQSPLDKTLRSLLVKDETIKNEKDRENKTKPPMAKVKSISEIITNNIQASTDLRTVTHYIKRAEQIWTTLLLKPNGDQRNLLVYDSEASDIKNQKLHDQLLTVVENYFTTKYPFEELAPQIIKDVLFRTGSYVHLSLSHAALDHLINGMEVDVSGNESFRSITSKVLAEQFVDGNWGKAKNVGYIRKERKSAAGSFVGFEALYNTDIVRDPEYHLVDPKLNFTFTDNPVVLKVGELASKMREERLRKIAGLEGVDSAINNRWTKSKGKKHKTNNNHVNAISKKTLDEQLDELYPDRHYDKNETLSVRKGKYYTGDGRGIGIDYHWPSEADIPVNINGEIGKPFGHILLLDPETGEPLKATSDVKFYQKTKGAGEEQQGPLMGSINQVIESIRNVGEGAECTEDMAWMVEYASATLEKELVEGFLNGDLSKDVTISLTEENKKLFWSRAMRQQGVRAVFVPSDYVTYVAIDYSRLGTGRSLVDEAKLHITRLAVLDTADALAQMENAISHTLLEITPEREDFDVRNTVAMARDEWFANNPTLHDIIGYNSVSIDAVLDRFKEQTLTIKVNPGDNQYIAAPEFQAGQMQREPLKSIDRETRENLLNTVAGYFGLKRSWLEDTGEGNDFAIEALADQELLRNQTNDYSRTFSRFFTEIMRKHIRVNEPLIGDLLDVIKENKKLYMKPDQGELDITDETKEKISQESDADDETSPEEMDIIRVVLKDFLNNFFVVLPTPAITDSLNKLEDKIEAVEKLATTWVELGGGSKMLRKRAEEVGLDGEAILESIKAVLLNEAFTRFNLPMPFEDILSNGQAGGILNIINKASDLDANVVKFLADYHKSGKKTENKVDKLKERIEKEEQEKFNDGELPPDDTVIPGEEGTIDENNPETDQVEEQQEVSFNDDASAEEQVEEGASEEMDAEAQEQAQEAGGEVSGTGDDIWDQPV